MVNVHHDVNINETRRGTKINRAMQDQTTCSFTANCANLKDIYTHTYTPYAHLNLHGNTVTS